MHRLVVSSRSSRFPLSMRKRASRWATDLRRNQNKLFVIFCPISQSFYRFLRFPRYCRPYWYCSLPVCMFGPDLRSLWFMIFMHLVTRLCLCCSTSSTKEGGQCKAAIKRGAREGNARRSLLDLTSRVELVEDESPIP